MGTMRLMKRDDGCVYPYHPARAKRENFRFMSPEETTAFLDNGVRPLPLKDAIEAKLVEQPVMPEKTVKTPDAPVSVVNLAVEAELKNPDAPIANKKSIALWSKQQIVEMALARFGKVLDVNRKKNDLIKIFKELG